MKSRSLFAARTMGPFFALSLVTSIQYAHAQIDGTWNADAPGNWSDPANWADGAVAGGAGATADFNTLNITGDHVITLDTPVTLGTLLSSDTVISNNWLFTGPGPLTLDNGINQPVIHVYNRLPVISAPLVGTNGLIKRGSGALTLAGNNSGLSGTLTLEDVSGTNSAGVILSGSAAVGGLTTININGTSNTGPYLALYGTTTVGSGVTINLGSQGGNNAPTGGLRAEGTNTEIVTIQGPLNITLTGNGTRIANNTAKRLDITGKIDGGTNGITFRVGKNEGIHITNTANTWSGPTIHSQETLWFEPGSLPTTSNLQICVSNPGTVQTSGTFDRVLGTAANQVQFALNAGRAQGFGARGGPLTLNFGGASADLLFDTNTGAVASRIRTSTLVLNGATADSDITLVNPIDLNGADRTIQVSSQTAVLQGGIKGGNFLVIKTGAGTLHLPVANTWSGGLTNTNAGIVRISHNEALGAAASVKTILMRGSNRNISLVELTGGISVDANKSLNISGKSFYASTDAATGNPVSLCNLSGNNAWLGSVIIGTTGGIYGIESTAGTLTLGSDPATTSVIQNTVANSVRQMYFLGGGDFVVNHKMADNGGADTSIYQMGSGTLSLTRADNDFDVVPNLWSGTTQVVKMADGGSVSSIGTPSSFNLGGTLKYTGTGDSSNRVLGLLQKGGTLDSSGDGALVLSATSMSHQAGTTAITSGPFAADVTVLSVDNAAAVAVGQSVTGTNIVANTTITAIDVANRQITLSAATTAASASGFGAALTIGGAATLDRTLTLTGSNAGDNIFAANLSDPGSGKLGIVKSGPGKWNLTGETKTNSGPLDVQQGILAVSGPLPAGPISVAAAATLSLDNASLGGSPALSIAGTLDLAGPVTVSVPSATGPGTYPILEYGKLTGAGPLTTVYRGASFATGATRTNLTIGAGAALTWTGNNGSSWDVMTTESWMNPSSNPETFYFLDSVTFDENGSWQPFVDLAEEVRPSSTTVNNPDTDYFLSGTGFISGLGGLTKSGAAKLTLGTANTFSGGVRLNAGTLVISNGRALGANGQVITIASGATLDTAGAFNGNRDYAATIADSGTAGDGVIVNTGIDHNFGFSALTLSADATIGGSGRWDLRPSAGSGSFAASVDLAGRTLTKVGSNTIALVDGSMTADGSIVINEGILSFTRMMVSGAGSINANAGSILRFENNSVGYYAKAINLSDATTHLTGSNLTIEAPITLTGMATFDISFTRTFVAAQAVGGSGALSLISSGTGALGVLVLQDDNTYQGATTVDVGTLRIGDRTATGRINTLPVTLSNNGNLQISRSDDACVFPNTIEGAGNVIIGADVAVTEAEYGSLVTLTGNNTFTGDVAVYSGGLRILDPAALGTGAKTISIGASYSRGTNGRPQFYLDGSAGNITLPAAVSFLTSSTEMATPAIGNLAGDNVIQGSITLASGGGSTAVNVIDGSLTLNGGIAANFTGRFLILGGSAGAPGTINGVISDGTDPLGLTLSGDNIWILTADNSYTAATTVNSGTLLVNGAQNLATGAVTVAGGTLGGNGVIGGNITVQAAGTLAPGTTLGTLTTVNSVTVNGNLAVEIAGAAADKLVVGSTLNIAGATLTVNPTGAGLNQPVYIIAEAGAPIVGSFGTVNVPAGYSVVVNHNGLNRIAIISGTPYGNWETANGIVGAGAAADSDGDGISNGIEFVIGGDPSGPGSASNKLLPTVSTDASYLNFVFRRADAAATYRPFVEYGSTLTAWTAAQHGTNGVIISDENDGFGSGIDRVSVRIPRTLAAPGSKLFARLRVDIP